MDSTEAQDQQLDSNIKLSNPNATELPMNEETGSTAPTEPTQEDNNRPEWLPEKFKSAEDLADAYRNLEKRLHTGKDVQDSQDGNQEGEQGSSDEVGQKQLPEIEVNTEGSEVPPEDFSRFSQEFDENGELSEASYKELADKHNLPKDVVDTYIQGQLAIREQVKSQVFEQAGGSEQDLLDLTQWARENADPVDIQAYNDAVQSGDPSRIVREVGVLRAKAEQAGAYGTEGNVYGIKKGTTVASPGFKTQNEYLTAMANPEYKTNPDYREEVYRKLRASSWRQQAS